MARTFGERFLSEYRRRGGSTRDWSTRDLAAIEKAERRHFTDTLRRVLPQAASTLAIAAHTAEPETLARRAVEAAAGGPDETFPTGLESL